jgi:hypothetical protein
LGVGALLLGAMLTAAGAGAAHADCGLRSAGGDIKHVIHIQFDNVHLRRDNPDVPSNLEQIPNLLNFMRDNGVVSGNHHTPLISHTATDILTILTGTYGDRMGVPVANSFGFFRPDGSVGFASSFAYWTALSADGKPLMVNESGKTAPAPWVPFTRAGCDVGAFSIANTEFESLPNDVRTVFGVGSPEDMAVTAALNLPRTPANAPARQAPNTDYLGIAIHCAQNSPLCSGSHARGDLLPDEPGGYSGFNALYGNVNVAPVICSAAPNACDATGNVKGTDGIVVQDAYGRPGFPNIFSPTAAQSLGYAATMLEAGVPVVYLYVADAHDRNPVPLDPVSNLPGPNHAFGAGEAEYVAQLKSYDVAFGKFFDRLKAAAITKDNTLLIVTADENDHFVGGPASPAHCDGVVVPCSYAQIGEITTILNRLLVTQRLNATPFDVHSDDAPTFYIHGNPAATDSLTRKMEHDLDALRVVNPITGNTNRLSVFLADRAEMALLHMVTSSAARTPSLTMFGNPDYFNTANSSSADCSQTPPCVIESPAFAWKTSSRTSPAPGWQWPVPGCASWAAATRSSRITPICGRPCSASSASMTAMFTTAGSWSRSCTSAHSRKLCARDTSDLSTSRGSTSSSTPHSARSERTAWRSPTARSWATTWPMPNSYPGFRPSRATAMRLPDRSYRCSTPRRSRTNRSTTGKRTAWFIVDKRSSTRSRTWQSAASTIDRWQ